MDIKDLKRVFRRTNVSIEKRVLIVKGSVSELPKEERDHLAESYERLNRALEEERDITKAGIKVSGMCYINGERIPLALFYEMSCAAAGQPILSPSRKLASYREKNKTKTRIPFKKFGVVIDKRRRRTYGRGMRSDNDPRY